MDCRGRRKTEDEFMTKFSTWKSGSPSMVHELVTECKKNLMFISYKKGLELLSDSQTAIVTEDSSTSRSWQRGTWWFFFLDFPGVSPGGQISHLLQFQYFPNGANITELHLP